MWVHPQLRARFNANGRGRWKETSIDKVPAIGGTYAVFLDAELRYIGSASNVRARLQDHAIGCKRQPFITHFGHIDRLKLKVAVDLKFGRWLMREARLIRRLNPPLNQTTWRTRK